MINGNFKLSNIFKDFLSLINIVINNEPINVQIKSAANTLNNRANGIKNVNIKINFWKVLKSCKKVFNIIFIRYIS